MRDIVSPGIDQTRIGIPVAMARRLALPAIILLAAVLRLWHLGDSGFGTEYYAASVRSMLSDPRNVFFGAFDPTGVLAVDKPPLALWVQALSAGVLGFGPFALMLPQAIEGCLAVLIVWHLTRRDFGDTAACLAALFLALTPISIAVDRSNNTDSLLVLVLLLAVWALPRTSDRAGPWAPSWRLALAMALTGVAFNVKMLAAFGVLPGFVAAYAFTARASWPRRMAHLAASGVVLAIVSVSWAGVVALTPASNRPYIDSTVNNSIFDLVINHNAAQRFIPRAGAATPGDAAPNGTPGQARAQTGRSSGNNRFTGRAVPPGPGRLIDPRLADQVLWLLPLAIAGAAGMIGARKREAAWVWIGWTVSYALVFSFAGGLFSAYYLVMLAPPLAVLAGVGVVTIARSWWAATWQRWWPVVVLPLSVAWQADILRPETWGSAAGVLLIVILAGLALACVVLIARRASPMAAFAIGVAALLLAPAAWSVGTVAYEGGRPLARLQPTPDRIGRAVARESDEMRTLLPFLREKQGDTAFLAATSSARLAAPLIIATGAPVVAFGGFMGTIPVLDGAAIAHLVDSGDLRFAVLGEGRGRRAQTTNTDATSWIRAHGTRLDLGAIAPELSDARFELFDLRQAP
jgi:4-amino-4-deoxy-L-arabinose transferase-like glycosyltransferase